MVSARRPAYPPAALAYSYWEARRCEEGSAEEDWLRAEEEVRERHCADEDAEGRGKRRLKPRRPRPARTGAGLSGKTDLGGATLRAQSALAVAAGVHHHSSSKYRG